MNAGKTLLVLPVRRKLMAAVLAYLSGIFLAEIIAISNGWIAALGMLLFLLGAMCQAKRKSMLFCVLMIMFLLGNWRAGMELSRRDMPTAPGVRIEGRITKIEKPYRVYLQDICVDGQEAQYARTVVVTLMHDEKADFVPEEPHVGQLVSGEGRLFAPDEKRNPGDVDWRIQAICKGYELSGYLLPGWAAEGEEVFSFAECMRIMRNAIRDRIAHIFGDQAALFQGIMLGDRSELEKDVTAAMRLTGTAHILTVSGLHLSMLAGVIGMLLGCMPINRKTRFALLSGFLLLFTALTGAAAGTVRACIMAMMREAARMRSRRYEPLTAIALAALLMTLVKPLWLLSASFQFSFLVVLGIQLFSGAASAFAARYMRGALSRISNIVSVSLCAQLGCVPMQLMLYGYVPLLSLPMNLLCALVMPSLLIGGWMTILVSVVSLRTGRFLGGILSVVADCFERMSLSMAGVKGSVLRLPAPQGGVVLLVLLLLLLLTERIRYGGLKRPVALLAAAAALVSYAVRFDPQARYVQLDVGQGDASLFRWGRCAVLVDVGPADSYEALRYLRHEGLYVDAVILSHLDEDHAGALGVLLASEVDIPAVILAEDAQKEETAQDVTDALELLAQKEIALYSVKRGDRIDVGNLAVNVLSPDGELSGSNERSLLLHATIEGVSFLLAGDLPLDSEPDTVPDVDVLKVAHHGSKNSTSDAFAAMASPTTAIISVGEGNWYGHPHKRVLNLFEDIDVLRTDEHGCITLYLEDGEYRAECFFDP